MSSQWEVVVSPFTNKKEAQQWVEIVRRKSKGWKQAKVQQVPHLEATIAEREGVDPTHLASVKAPVE